MATPQQLLEQSNRRLVYLQSDLLPSLAQNSTSSGLSPEELDARAREARADLVGLERAVVELRHQVEDTDDASTRSTLLARVEMLAADVAAARGEYRRSLMEAAKSADLVGAQRATLIPDASQSSNDDPLQEKANQVTLALRKTTELMRAELDSSVMASQLLDESTQTIKSTNSLYIKYSSLLDQSSQLIRALERTNYWDRICILAGVAFFLCTCGWILKRRVFDKAVGGLASVIFGAGRLAGQARKVPVASSSALISPVGEVVNFVREGGNQPPVKLAAALEAAAPAVEGGSTLAAVVIEGKTSLSAAADDARSRDEL